MNLEENVRQWLSEEDLLREVKYDENADFHYIIEFPKENIMDVVKPEGKDCLIVACATQVAPQHLDLMKQSDNKTQKDFIMDLQRLLLAQMKTLQRQYVFSRTACRGRATIWHW